MTEDLDRAGARLEQAGDDLEQGALAGTVRADDGEQAAGLDGEIDVLERDAVAVADRDVGEPHIRMGPGVARIDPGVDRVEPALVGMGMAVLVRIECRARCSRGAGRDVVWISAGAHLGHPRARR